MYRTKFKHTCRINEIAEAIDMEIPTKDVELFIYCIDIYTLALNDKPGKVYLPIKAKLKKYLLDRYNELHVPFPGILDGWTKAILVWILYLCILTKTPKPKLTKRALEYINKSKLRMFQHPDADTWDIYTIMNILDCLSLRWNTLEKTSHLRNFLDIVWYRIAEINLYIQDPNDFVCNNGYFNTKGYVSCVSRFHYFESNFCYFIEVKEDTRPLLEWMEKEKQYLVSTRFRESLLEFVWKHTLLAGDVQISMANDLEEKKSSYACINERCVPGLINMYQKLTTYADYEDIMKSPIGDYLVLMLFNEKLNNVYNIEWFKFFYVQSPLEHKTAVEAATVPLIMFSGHVLCLKDGEKLYSGRAADLITKWLKIVESRSFICFDSLDFESVYKEIFENAMEDDTSIPNTVEIDF